MTREKPESFDLKEACIQAAQAQAVGEATARELLPVIKERLRLAGFKVKKAVKPEDCSPRVAPKLQHLTR